MAINVKPETNELVQNEIRSGDFGSVGEIVKSTVPRKRELGRLWPLPARRRFRWDDPRKACIEAFLC
jgi:hypothetical protein